MRRISKKTAYLGLIAALTACVVAPPTAPQPRPRPVPIPYGHVHTDDCGHYRDGSGWYHLPGHKHGPGCGHEYQDGAWILLR